MDIDRIIRNMPRDSREVLKAAVENYKRTGNREHAETALNILKNFDDDPNVKELVRTLKK